MTYVEFKSRIKAALDAEPSGMTWKELKQAQNLPYKTPCPEWMKRLEKEIGLDRNEKAGNARIWKTPA